MKRILSKEEWLRRRRIKNMIMTVAAIIMFVIIVIVFAQLITRIMSDNKKSNNPVESITETLSNGMVIKQNYLTPNKYSRPQTELKQVKGIVIHYTANPGTSAKSNRSYFQGLATEHTTYASSHFIIGLKGEIIQCIPLNEISYASNDRNPDTISIECCHPDETGKFNDETYSSLISLTAVLCKKFNLGVDDVIRHYDVTEKMCPLYYVKNPEAWTQLKADVADEIKKLG
jgi:N-acetylmuramoyl-L-alanine amidase CwlA